MSSSQAIPDTCPFCGSELLIKTHDGWRSYSCSTLLTENNVNRGLVCCERQIANLTATVAEQEAEIEEMREVFNEQIKDG